MKENWTAFAGWGVEGEDGIEEIRVAAPNRDKAIEKVAEVLDRDYESGWAIMYFERDQIIAERLAVTC